jgi:hypothetical protein
VGYGEKMINDIRRKDCLQNHDQYLTVWFKEMLALHKKYN